MTTRTPRDVHDVASQKMCTGCGVCAYLAPDEVRMADVLDYGRRPLPLLSVRGPGAAAALSCCPGVKLEHESAAPGPGEYASLRDAWGPVLRVYEGYAADPEIRFAGSSGGVATALAAYCIAQEGMTGALHIGARQDVPYLNEARLSRSRDELLANAGSRYAPASPCERLDLVEAAETPCVFIGKPCDVAAVSMARRERPALDRKVGLTVAVFCAGTPSTRGTLEMLKVMGVDDPSTISHVAYRGQGWPGNARTRVAGESTERTLTYEQSWGDILQKHRQWRCYLCADHTGEFADVAVGDPWYRPTAGDPGRSLVLARTERGLKMIEAAIAAGALVLEQVGPELLPASQPNLLRARGAVWGRVVTLRAAGLMTPRTRHLPMAKMWRSNLSTKEKLQSTVGTVRRIKRKNLRAPADLTPMED